MFEIKWRIKAIIERLDINNNFELSIHGMKRVGGKSEAPKQIKLTKQQEKAMEIALKKAKERKTNGRKISN